MASKHEIIVRNVITFFSVEHRGRLYTMQQGLMTPWGSDNPIWIGPYPGKRTKGFPDIFGFEFEKIKYPATCPGEVDDSEIIPVYCVIEVKTIKDKLKPDQIFYLNYASSIGAFAYVAKEDESEKGYNLERWKEC